MESYLKYELPDTQRLILLYRDVNIGALAAEQMSDIADELGVEVTDLIISPDREIDEALLQDLQGRGDGTVLMLWLDGADLKRFTHVAPLTDGAVGFISSNLLGESPVLTESEWDDRLQVIHPFNLPWKPSGGISRGFLV